MQLVIQAVLTSVALLAGPRSHLLDQCPDWSHNSWAAGTALLAADDLLRDACVSKPYMT